jgi:putative OPT family oligopeptide transporter
MANETAKTVRELSFRSLILGAAITTVFTAANVYLGLKVGLTFASSIPAAVISMAVLSAFKGATILENNIVQTVASAAGTLSSIIFVLPGLVIVGWWTGFPFWTSFLICVSGGVLGVLFTIPLRRALVTHSDLPYPEGVAAAEVLKVGSEARHELSADAAPDSREGLMAVIWGTIAATAVVAIAATQIAAGEFAKFFKVGANSESSFDFGFSLALVGAGHLVGLSVGLALLGGVLIAWGGAVPILTALDPAPAIAIADHATAIWVHKVRFIGAGTIAVAAIWTLLKLAKPVAQGLASTLAASPSRGKATADESDRDLSGGWIGILALACIAISVWLVWTFATQSVLAPHALALTLFSIPFVLIVGFLIATVCGYMAGLIGSSNSPISGVGILTIVSCAGLLLLFVTPSAQATHALVALALFVTAIVFAVATISNDNLQDLKTGQLVGASPRRQQIALIVGVIAGAVVIPPVLDLLAHAYGFAGAANLHAIVAKPLPAPQATLISALAQGVIGGNLNWLMVGIGALLGLALVVLDELLGWMKWTRLPPLAIGIGIYLPMSATLAVALGAFLGHWYNARAKRAKDPGHAERMGVLVASGMIVGESLFGVVLAGLIVGLSKDAPLAIVPDNFAPAPLIGVITFVGFILALYGWLLARIRR